MPPKLSGPTGTPPFLSLLAERSEQGRLYLERGGKSISPAPPQHIFHARPGLAPGKSSPGEALLLRVRVRFATPPLAGGLRAFPVGSAVLRSRFIPAAESAWSSSRLAPLARQSPSRQRSSPLLVPEPGGSTRRCIGSRGLQRAQVEKLLLACEQEQPHRAGPRTGIV